MLHSRLMVSSIGISNWRTFYSTTTILLSSLILPPSSCTVQPITIATGITITVINRMNMSISMRDGREYNNWMDC